MFERMANPQGLKDLLGIEGVVELVVEVDAVREDPVGIGALGGRGAGASAAAAGMRRATALRPLQVRPGPRARRHAGPDLMRADTAPPLWSRTSP